MGLATGDCDHGPRHATGRRGFYRPCDCGDAKGMFSSKADSFQATRSFENMPGRGPMPKGPWLRHSTKEGRARPAPGCSLGIVSAQICKCCRMFIKEKIYNNSVADMLLISE